MNAPFPLLSCSYDDGDFDKDEQGWVASRTAVSSNVETGAVTIRHSGDRNGLDPYDTVIETNIVEVLSDRQVVKFAHPRWAFDLASNRLIEAHTLR